VARETVSRYRTLGVVAKGGHLEGGADDLVVDRSGEMTWLPGERVVSRATHGTGCAFSSAMVCGLAMGLTGVEAAREAKRFVTVAIRRATPKGRGTGAMNLYWPMRVDEG
jgi:hydroxymethylpyrimidine/phosphomethylpyrimidine kinase